MDYLLRKARPSSVPPVAVETEDTICNYEFSLAAVAPLSPDEFSVSVIQPLGKNIHKRKQTDSAVPPSFDPCVIQSPPALYGAGSDRHKSPDTLKLPDDRDGSFPHITSETKDEICSFREEEQTPIPKHVKRVSDLTLYDPKSDSDVFGDSQVETVPVMEHAVRLGKKGSCYKCLKGNRFIPKEVCIVCSAKYCRSCVLRAMGSMPEGRKCVTCIGYGIDERKRNKLGKCSRMMKGLLSESIVAQAMHNERYCEVNQIPPELVWVNLQPLNREQLKLLLNCQNPPKQLKAGSYWYDKTCGLWGKQGQPPSEMISPHLDVGGRLHKNASNGNTNVIINYREITKQELWILKLVGVPCEGTPHFWVNADGSYREEGQNIDRGYIWDKCGARLASAILSLPVPSKSVVLSCEGENLSGKTLDKFVVGSVNSDAISFSFSWAVDNAIRSESETASNLGASPARSFTSGVDSAIRSSRGSEADLGTSHSPLHGSFASTVDMRAIVE